MILDRAIKGSNNYQFLEDQEEGWVDLSSFYEDYEIVVSALEEGMMFCTERYCYKQSKLMKELTTK